MRGVTFKGNREAEIREFPDPHAGPGEAVLRIRASGLCGTDLHRYRDAEATEMITGHEPCGVIEELGPGAPPGLKIGDRVMCHHYEGCGTCEICSMGYEQLCPHGHVTFGGGTGHGANADYMICPSRTLVHLPDELSFEEGAAISCGTGHGLERAQQDGRQRKGHRGRLRPGPVGLSGTLSAKAMGARVIAIDVMDERLQLATELGADHTINAAASDPVQAIRDLTGGQGATASWRPRATPRRGSRRSRACGPFARACYVGIGGPAEIDFNREVIFKVLTVYGSWTFSKAELIEIARFFVDTGAPLDRLITHRYGLDEAVEAFQTFDGATTGKCVFVFD